MNYAEVNRRIEIITNELSSLVPSTITWAGKLITNMDQLNLINVISMLVTRQRLFDEIDKLSTKSEEQRVLFTSIRKYFMQNECFSDVMHPYDKDINTWLEIFAQECLRRGRTQELNAEINLCYQYLNTFSDAERRSWLESQITKNDPVSQPPDDLPL